MSKAAAATAGGDAGGKGKGGSKKLLIIGLVIALVVAIAAGGAAFMMMSKGKQAGDEGDDEDAEVVEKSKKPPQFYSTDAYTVNLADENRERYLQTQVVYEIADPAVSDALKNFAPAIRSQSLVLLSTKTATELMTAEGKQKLQADLLDIARRPFKGTATAKQIKAVHFTSFVVQ